MGKCKDCGSKLNVKGSCPSCAKASKGKMDKLNLVMGIGIEPKGKGKGKGKAEKKPMM